MWGSSPRRWAATANAGGEQRPRAEQGCTLLPPAPICELGEGLILSRGPGRGGLQSPQPTPPTGHHPGGEMDPQGGPGHLLGHTVSPWLLFSLFPIFSESNMTAQGHMGMKGIVHRDKAIARLYRGHLSYPPGNTSKSYSRSAS